MDMIHLKGTKNSQTHRNKVEWQLLGALGKEKWGVAVQQVCNFSYAK